MMNWRTEEMMNWRTREQWAKARTTVYADMDNPRPASKRLSDYASPEEIEAAVAAIKRVYCDCGRKMKLLKDSDGRDADGLSRDCYRYRRREINLALNQIRQNEVPWIYVRSIKPLPPELGLILDRYAAAKQRADEAWAREVAATPVDDAAREEELEHRRECERRFGR